MADIAQQLESLQQRIAARNTADTRVEDLQYVAIAQTGDVFNLDFYGYCFGEGYDDLLSTIAMPSIAPSIRSLIIRGPDEGANGTRNWDIEPLLSTDATFTNLETFSIQLNQPADYNRTIIRVIVNQTQKSSKRFPGKAFSHSWPKSLKWFCSKAFSDFEWYFTTGLLAQSMKRMEF